MGANAVIEKWQWMQQDAAAVRGKQVRELRDAGLCFRAQITTKHENHIALRLADGLAQGVEVARLNTQLFCRRRVVRISQRQHRGVLSAGRDMNELRCLFAQADRDAVDYY